MPDTLRLFFALWPDELVRAALLRASPTPGPGGRGVPADNLHITLAFLGATPPERLSTLTAAAAQVRGRAFSLQLDRSEILNRALVALMPSATPPALMQLAADLNARLAAAAFPAESRTYRPHVTVIRENTRGGGRRHALMSSEEVPIESVAWDVDAFVLACSHPGATGSRYEVLQRWPLAR